jgi:HSP20 family protein
MSKDLIRLMHTLFQPRTVALPDVYWHPAADVYRTRTGWLVKFELAGVRKEDIHLTAHGHRLIVKGHRRDCSLEEGDCCYCMEIAYNQFERTIELPCNLDVCPIDAEHREGMLLVRIRTEEAQP